MALQTQNLAMVGLGIQNDSPPNPLQPRLVDGVHLRWAFKRDLGFPWHGYYLFRRLHREGELLCLSHAISGLPTGPLTDTMLHIPGQGQIHSDESDENLLLTDAFPPAGTVEFDLDNRRSLRFTPAVGPVRWIEVHIGFRDAAEIEVTARLWETPVKSTYTAQPHPGTRLCTAAQSINHCRVSGWSGSFWTAWDWGCPSRRALTVWHNICSLILVRGAGEAAHRGSLPATRRRGVREVSKGCRPPLPRCPWRAGALAWCCPLL